MGSNYLFLNLNGLDDDQVRDIEDLLHPANLSSEIEFPWNEDSDDEQFLTKGGTSSLNVHAPAFEAYVPACNNHTHEITTNPHHSLPTSYSNGSNLQELPPTVNNAHYYAAAETRTLQPLHQNFSNGQPMQNMFEQCVTYSQPPKPFNGNFYSSTHNPQLPLMVSTSKLNPTVSSFVPQNIENYPQPPLNGIPAPSANILASEAEPESPNISEDEEIVPEQNTLLNQIPENVTENGLKPVPEPKKSDSVPVVIKDETVNVEKISKVEAAPVKIVARSWADVVSRGQKPTERVPLTKPVNGSEKSLKVPSKDEEADGLSISEDNMALMLGKHLHELKLNFLPTLLQPRGLINRRNWCYVNASLQALLACPPFYTLLRNLPLGPGVERGKSSTPVIDSMLKVTYEFSQYDSVQEELQVGQPFQPDFIYDMLRDLKSDCLKGQQEDAEEFLSFILNGMHEEMVKIIKNYEKRNQLNLEEEMKENGDISDGEDEWQVISSKHKGMVIRKVAEHKTPISDLLGGQIKSFLTTSGNKTSASIQPFFTLQLDVQSENVTSVSEALKEMTVKEPIQGYTCAKTKQEVEAFSHIALQKLPPILILHLKRFVYNKNGGCKKVLKKTDYPLVLEISRDMFSSDVKKNQRLRQYKLFAVMYHDGEEAVKGHYISDVYNHGSQTWIRCDDRQVTSVTEEQVLSHSPPRVPYLLFYQES